MLALLRFFLGLEVFLPVYLVFEVALPVLRDKPKFRATRWLGRKLMFFFPKQTSTESLLDASTRRLREAKMRMEAARTDLAAAELEQKALSMEDDANDLREKSEDD